MDTDLLIFGAGVVITIIGWLINRNVNAIDTKVSQIEEDLSDHRKSSGERVGDLERRISLEYVTKEELQVEHKAVMEELTNMRRLIEKIFDKIDSVKDNYVSVGTCNEHRSHCSNIPKP